MITFFLCFFSVCCFFTAVMIGGTLFCLLFAALGVLSITALFAYFGLFFLSSANMLIYAGLFLVLFFVFKNMLSDDKLMIKKLLFFAFCLLITTSLCYIIISSNLDPHCVAYNFDSYENKMNIVIVLLIVSVSIFLIIFSKYNLTIERKKSNDNVQLLSDEESDKSE